MPQNLNKLIEHMNSAGLTDVSETVSFRALVILRNQLMHRGIFNKTTANEIAVRINIKTTENYSNEQLIKIIKPYSTYLLSMAVACLNNGFTISDFCYAVATMELKF